MGILYTLFWIFVGFYLHMFLEDMYGTTMKKTIDAILTKKDELKTYMEQQFHKKWNEIVQ